MFNHQFTVVAAVNDLQVLEKNLYLSPDLKSGNVSELILKKDCVSASSAYNRAIEDAGNDLIVFVHQDIYLPSNWFNALSRAIDHLESRSENWGVLGCFGSRQNATGGLGRVYTTGLGLHGRPLKSPVEVETLDEIVLVINRASKLRFDESLPHFHLYGADICMTARSVGLSNYAFQGFCVHNTNQLVRLPREFYQCYWHIRKKWAKQLPIYTSCMKISRFNEQLIRKKLSEVRDRKRVGRAALKRMEDPRDAMACLGIDEREAFEKYIGDRTTEIKVDARLRHQL